MARNKSSADVEDIGVFDLNMACAYYACVFDAEADAGGATDVCEMKIGDQRYRLVHCKIQKHEDAPHCAVVEDVDVSIARVATKGGRIIDRAARTDAGDRVGCVQDPFGHRWVVKGRA